jgi:hypothetical protein
MLEHQPGQRDCEQPGQGGEVPGSFDGEGAPVSQAPGEEDRHAGDDQDRCDVEEMEDQPSQHTS